MNVAKVQFLINMFRIQIKAASLIIFSDFRTEILKAPVRFFFNKLDYNNIFLELHSNCQRFMDYFTA